MDNINNSLTDKIRLNKNYDFQRNKILLQTCLTIILSIGVNSISRSQILVDTTIPKIKQPILSANNSGISHNKYAQFNVDTKGIVLNNYLSDQYNNSVIDSPLDSHIHNGISIESNELLRSSGPAKVILNEVTSLSTPTILNGPIAVTGTQANIIIANPQGIECNNCGFINTHIVTLAAATPEISYGNMPFLSDNTADVKFTKDKINGEIVFSGSGLSKEANQSDYTTLIAHTIKVNAKIHAHAGLAAVLVGDDKTMHSTSLDVAYLGGMYADDIT